MWLWQRSGLDQVKVAQCQHRLYTVLSFGDQGHIHWIDTESTPRAFIHRNILKSLGWGKVQSKLILLSNPNPHWLIDFAVHLCIRCFINQHGRLDQLPRAPLQLRAVSRPWSSLQCTPQKLCMDHETPTHLFTFHRESAPGFYILPIVTQLMWVASSTW